MRPSLYDFIYAVVFGIEGMDANVKNTLMQKINEIYGNDITYMMVLDPAFGDLIRSEGNENCLTVIRKVAKVYFSIPKDKCEPCNYMVHYAGGFTYKMIEFVKRD